ncbi:hypothetical protein SDC9_197512 [bioreactor metagenome]|uniref:Uncharacterized protein n=1 Tax=bioreactor metagenome TaxID=1076179 RepID=A0A645IF10_9ZZZZ
MSSVVSADFFSVYDPFIGIVFRLHFPKNGVAFRSFFCPVLVVIHLFSTLFGCFAISIVKGEQFMLRKGRKDHCLFSVVRQWEPMGESLRLKGQEVIK